MTINNESYTNIADILSLQARYQPDATAIYTPKESYSYSKLEKLVCKASVLLGRNGIESCNVAALDIKDEFLHIIFMLATAKIGATHISMPRDTPTLLYAKTAEDADIDIIITDSDNRSIADLPMLHTNINSIENIPLPTKDIQYYCKPNAPWIIIVGSGSTGDQKLIPITHEQEIMRTYISANDLPISNNDRVASFIPIMYSDTKRRLLETFFAGAVFIIFDKESLTVSKMKNEYQITILRTTVYHIEKVLHTFVKTRQKPFDFLRILSIGTAVVSDELRERISKYLTSKLYITYGTNETGTVSAANLSKYPNISGSVGLAFSGVQIEIVDNEGKPLKKGIIGNVRIKTPGAILGYMNNQTATDKAFKNGWFYPGDRGKLTEDGQLIYMGRSDHMMIINGINIYPIEIEKVVITHPCVKDAAALPIRLSQQVAIPVCAVELNEMCNTTEEELKTYAYQYLGSRSPAKIIILDRIPRNSIGKLDHKELQTKTIHGFKNSVSYVKH